MEKVTRCRGRRTSGKASAASKAAALIVSTFLLPATAVWAQDAGQLLRDSKGLRDYDPFASEAPELIDKDLPRPVIRLPKGVTLAVSRFTLSGNTHYASEQLSALLRPWEGQTLDVDGLNAAAGAITRYYQSNGHLLTYAYLPVQKVVDGVVEIAVMEGSVDSVKIVTADDVRLKNAVISQHLEDTVVGKQVQQRDLEHKLLLLNEIPGVVARATFAPGSRPGTADMIVTVAEEEPFAARFGLNNYGSESTGELRAWGQFGLNNIFGLGDSTRLLVQVSEKGDMVNSFVHTDVPLGGRGWSVGAGFGHLTYELGGSFSALSAHGEADFFELGLRYAAWRSPRQSLNVTADYEYKDLEDVIVLLSRSKKSSHKFTLGLNLLASDDWLGGGVTRAELGVTAGRLTHKDSSVLPPVAGLPLADKYFRLLDYSLSRQQFLGHNWQLSLSLYGQHAFHNLDSSEKMSLTGPHAVRGYAPSLASADQVLVGSVELGKSWPLLGHSVRVYAFHDYANGGYLHEESRGINNWVSLYANGLGLNWNNRSDLDINLSVGWRGNLAPGTPSAVSYIDGNGQPRTRGQQRLADGTDREPFVYMQMISGF